MSDNGNGHNAELLAAFDAQLGGFVPRVFSSGSVGFWTGGRLIYSGREYQVSASITLRGTAPVEPHVRAGVVEAPELLDARRQMRSRLIREFTDAYNPQSKQ